MELLKCLLGKAFHGATLYAARMQGASYKEAANQRTPGWAQPGD
jgi:hypothetical protein